MAVEFQDSHIVLTLTPSNGVTAINFRDSGSDAIALAQAWAESDTIGEKFAVLPALVVAKVV